MRPQPYVPVARIGLIICVALTVIAGARARQPTPESLLADLTTLERQAADATRTIEERERAADRAIERRRALIEAAGEDPRRIIWLIDQASAVLARLSRDASDTAVLVAVPTEQQRARVKAAAEEAGTLLEQARQAAGAVTEQQTRLSLREGEEGNVLLAALRDEQVRGAFVRGRVHVLLGATDDRARPEHAQEAIDALGGIGMDDPAAEAARRTNLGLALVLRGVDGDARAAMTNLDFAAGEQRTGRAGTLPGTTAEALLGRLHAAGPAGLDGVLRDLDKTRDRPPRTTRGRPDPLWHLLFADAVGRALIARWRDSRDAALLGRAFESHRGFLEGQTYIGLDGDALRSAVWDRMDAIVRLTGDPAPVADLPAVAVLAHAVTLAREPARRAEARHILEALSAREDAGSTRADALWEMGVIAADSGDAGAALDVTARFAREFPTDHRADDAIEYALHYARERYAADTNRAEARRAYLDALRVATSSFAHAPHVERWRLERARLLLEPSADQDRAEGLALLEAIPPDSPQAAEADATYERAQGETLDGLKARLAAARDAGDIEEARRLAEQAAAEARRAAAWAGSRSRPSLERFLADRAEAQVESGMPDDAAGVCRDLLSGGRAGRVPGGEARVRLMLGRALLLGGDEPGAFASLRELVSPFDASGAGATRPAEFWHAWALMLEVLARDPHRAGAVRVQVKRLQAIDSALGGEPWRARILAAAER